MDTHTSSLMSLSHLTANFASLDHGTVPSVSGIWLLVTPLDDSSDTPRYILLIDEFFYSEYYRMSSLSLSQLTIVKLCLPLATVPSSCGTLWVFASTPSRNKVTPNGYLASDSHHLLKTPSLFPLAGISWSKSGIFPTASSSATTTVTLDT